MPKSFSLLPPIAVPLHVKLQVQLESPSTMKWHLSGLTTIQFSWNHVEILLKSALGFSIIIDKDFPYA